jgi:hypothetical protein
MKQLILLSIWFCFLDLAVRAQDNVDQNNSGGKLESLKIGYITDRMKLTPEEAQRFWPVYNQYAQELRDARMANRNKTEIEMDEILLNIRKKYSAQFGAALPPNKVNQFFRSEREFTNFVRGEWLRRAQQRRMQQPRRPFGNRP